MKELRFDLSDIGKLHAQVCVSPPSALKRREPDGQTFRFRRVMRVVERTIDKYGQTLPIPDIEIEGCWTTLDSARMTTKPSSRLLGKFKK